MKYGLWDTKDNAERRIMKCPNCAKILENPFQVHNCVSQPPPLQDAYNKGVDDGRKFERKLQFAASTRAVKKGGK